MAEHPSRVGESTRAVHGGEREHRESNSLTTPIHQTSTFWFEHTEELRAYAEGRLIRDEYGRYSNPTWRAVQRKICELEGAEEAVLFASGMCAATTTFLAMIPQGGHIVVTSDCYRRTRQFIQQYLSKLDVEATVIDPANTIQLKDAIREETCLFFYRVADQPLPARDRPARGRPRRPRTRRQGDHRLDPRRAR